MQIFKQKIIKHACAVFLVIFLSVPFAGCMKSDQKQSAYTSYKDVPGVTHDEIKAIDALRNKYDSFIYGMTQSTEAFYGENNEIRGYSALLCEWLTGLFNIQFKPAIYEWGDLLEGLETGEIAFSGDLTPIEERLKKYIMTDEIAMRPLIAIRIRANTLVSEISISRPLRYAFLKDSTVIDSFSHLSNEAFDAVFVEDYDAVYNLLKNGEIDSFIVESTAETAFDAYNDIYAEDFLPVIYSPVSMTTQNPAFAPIISVVQKVLQSGAINHLNDLYNSGYREYNKRKLSMRLSDEELSYIKNHPIIPLAAEGNNYPVSFFNPHNRTWEGIAIDVLREVEALTGLSFKILTNKDTTWAEMVKMLETGAASVLTELIQTKEREEAFLWPQTAIMSDSYSLISKSDYRDISISEIPYVKVGLVKGTVHIPLFESWFPNQTNTIVYSDTVVAFDALEHGEIDMVMTGLHQLLTLTNYRERPGFKANIVFDRTYDSKFGFNKNETVLCSIIDKTLKEIDTNKISGHWLRKTYDDRAKLAQARLPGQIGATVLLFSLILVLLLYQIKHKERKRLEDLVQKRTAKLEAVIGSYKGIIWSVDAAGVVTTFSGQYLKNLEIKQSFIEGKHLDTACRKNRHLDIVDNVGKTFHEGPQDWISEIDGKVFHSCTTPIYDSKGKIIDIVGSTDEVTDTIKLQKDLKTALEAAEAASVSKTAFIANMSHEIRTPMNSIIGFSELAMDNDIKPETKDYLDKIIENSNWLLTIINDILDISKIEVGKMELECVPFDLHEIFIRCQTLTMPKAIEKGLVLHFYAEPTIGKKLLGDPTRLHQIFINLLSNAIKFTNIGAVKLSSFIINSDDDSCTICFEIRDSGIGMTPEQIKKIFKPFTQADSSMTRIHGGTGLGLSITKNLVELMGGELTAESVPGIGSKFSFKLTFKTIDIPDYKPSHKTITDIEKPNFEGEILICEDNLMNQRVICEHLSRVGLKVEVAANGKEGIEMVQKRIETGKKPFDLIFMDIHMPVMDGLEATPKILELNTGTPIVAMTANIMADDISLYKTKGMPDCITKPFTSQELWCCLLKYFTPVKNTEIKTNVNENSSATSDEELLTLLLIDFVKNNRFKYIELISALDSDDIKLAHRLAHNLKTNAGLIHKPQLQKAAADVEMSLKGGKNLITETQKSVLETELNTVIEDLEPFLKSDTSTVETQTEIYDAEKSLQLLEALEPLLKSGNPDCLNFINDLRSVQGSEELIQHMEDFNFRPAALETLNKIKQKMEKK